MAVPNVDKITSTLARLPDQALQQYAAMHKNDPYIMSLAMSESNRRKELRAAAQAPQGMQEQPKVVDAALAQMAPQESGIAALPAPNMQMMADGGIAGYEGYGEGDESYGQEPVMMMAGGGAVERYQSQGLVQPRARWEDALAELQAPPQESSALGRGITDFFTRSSDLDAIRQNARAKQIQGLPLSAQEKAVLQADAQAAPVASRQPSALEQERTRNMQQVANEGYTRGDPRALPSMPSAAEQLAASNAAPTADKKGGAAPRPGAGGPTAPAAGPRAPAQAGLSDLAKLRQDILSKQQFTDPAAAGLKELEARELASAEADKAALLRDQAKFDDAYKGREKRLLDRELDIGKQKDTNVGLAFLGAAATAMSTPGGLAKALGAAAQVGTAQFSAGLDKIRSAQERLDDARDKMEDLKLNRAEMSAKEIRAAEKSIRSVGVDAQKRTIDGIRMAADVNEKRATDIYKSVVDVGMNREKIAAERENTLIREGGADRRAMMPTGADRTAMMLGEGKTDAQRLESGMRKLQEITADKSGMAAVKVLADINAKRMPGEPAVTMNDLLIGAREFSSLMYGPKVADVAPTRDRPR